MICESELENPVDLDESTENICHINKLPPEVLDIIFSMLVRTRNIALPKQLRLVCKLWFQNCSRLGTIYLAKDIDKKAANLPPECTFERLEVTFGEPLEINDPPTVVTGLNQLPVAFWLDFGTKIKVLDLFYCQLGDQVMKNIILFGHNLQSLHVDLLVSDKEPLCSPEMLEGLKVVRSKLHTLEIRFDGQRNPVINYDFVKWKRIFAALLRIFPEIVRYNVGDLNDYFLRKWDSNDEDFKRFRIEFFLNRANISWTQAMESELASSLAFSLSVDGENWKDALSALSTLARIVHVTLHFKKVYYTQADKTALINFFEDHRELESIQLELEFTIDELMSKLIFFQIVENCTKLRELMYGLEFEASWLNSLTTEEWSRLFAKTSQIHKLSLGESILRTFSKSQQLMLNSSELSKAKRYMTIVIQNLTYIQDLNLVGLFFTDEILQCILHFMVNLRGLLFEIGKNCTTFGLTGYRSDVENSCKGYSISRLKNLERLRIVQNERRKTRHMIDSTILFREFNLPQLRILTCHPPEDQKILADLGEKMPVLEEVILKKPKISSQYLVNFCRSFKNLRSLSAHNISFNIDEAKEIFAVCPSLRYLRRKYTFSGYYYEPFTKEVRRFD